MTHGPRAWRTAALMWSAAVVAFGLVPTHAVLQAAVGERETAATVLGHFGEYALLAFLLAGALGGWRRDLRAALLAAALAVGLGAAIELVQVWLPYRDSQLSDVLVNALGTAAGLLLFSAAAPGKRARPRARRG